MSHEMQPGTLTELFVAITTLMSVIIGAIVSWRIFKREPSRTYDKERYEKVIYPLFKALEDYLFAKKITPKIESIILICQMIVQENQMIAGGKLIDIFSHQITVENFYAISLEVDKQYDKACKQLGIPVRSLSYKINKYGWKCKRYNLFFVLRYMVLYPCIGFIIIFLFLIIVGYGFSLLQSLLNNIVQPK